MEQQETSASGLKMNLHLTVESWLEEDQTKLKMHFALCLETTDNTMSKMSLSLDRKNSSLNNELLVVVVVVVDT